MNWSLAFYRGLSSAVEPVAGPLLSLFAREERNLREERMGRGALTGPVDTWWHAASLGEVGALEPLLAAASARGIEGRFVVTTSTAAGRREARARWGERAELAPLDLPGAIRRATNLRRPRAVMLVETEIWPNWIRTLEDAGVPWAVVNARLSDRSWPRYRRFRGLWKPLLAGVAAVAARGAEDARRWIELGAPAERVRITGNLKVDRLAVPPPAELPWEPGPVWTVGSLREGELLPVLAAFEGARARHPDLRLVLAPRHPDRWGRLDTELTARGFRIARRSRPAPSDGDADILLLDTHGELPSVYAASTFCLVGGTLVPVGGHNPLEAAVAGRPVLLGPYVDNVREEARTLSEAGGAVLLDGPQDLAGAVTAWLEDPGAGERVGIRAREAVRSLTGAADRTLSWLVERGVLVPREGDRGS